MSREVIFRLDSSDLIGSGHVFRCLNLSDSLTKLGIKPSFICRNHEGSLINLIKDNGYTVHCLTKPSEELSGKSNLYSNWLSVSQKKDALETVNILKAHEMPILVIDHYGIDIKWEQIVRKVTHKLFVIDDLANRKHDCDFLLDQNLQTNSNRYNNLVSNSCKLFLGPKFALLDKNFLKASKERSFKNYFIKVLIFLGSYDINNETAKAVKGVYKSGLNNIEVAVIVGSKNPHKKEIKKLCKTYDYNFFCQVDNMAEFISNADVGIGACGSSSWERCYLGLPTITTVLADNQKEVSKLLKERKAIHFLGDYKSTTEESYGEGLKKIIDNRDYMQKLSTNSAKIVSYGTNFIADIIFKQTK